METSKLKEKIEETKEKLIPLFGITEVERKLLQTPLIIRNFEEKDYDGRNKLFSGYDGVRNIFFFPDIEAYLGFNPQIPKEQEIEYHTASYLHFRINPSLRRTALENELTKKVPEVFYTLRSLVPVYTNIVTDKASLKEHGHLTPDIRKAFHLFIEKGPAFLPQLARMSLEELGDLKF